MLITSDIVAGVADLSNWEGEYLGEVTSIELLVEER